MNLTAAVRWLFDPDCGASDRLVPRWLFLRALGLIYFSAFFSLLFQVRGLIGTDGLLPADVYLPAVSRALGPARFWFAPTLLWLSAGNAALMAVCWAGLIASLLLVVNIWPRATLAVCFACFLSFIATLQDFSAYQSDGMLLAAGLLAILLAPPGLRPGLGASRPPARAPLFLLLWEWFRIYFESGVAKLGGDPEWRHLTAMDHYYQNGPLPTWIAWYAQQLPHAFHAATALATLVLELAVVFLMFAPRRLRLTCFFIVTGWQIGVILTANYAFLNYLVLALGFLLLDDPFLARWMPGPRRGVAPQPVPEIGPLPSPRAPRSRAAIAGLSLAGVVLVWVAYATTVPLLEMLHAGLPLPIAPIRALQPFRVANSYGLFGRMTRGRYEIEFQGSNDGQSWTAYPFRYKPQALSSAPGIYAPYQPRFDWDLWFASLGGWRDYPFVARTEEQLLRNAPDVLALFAGNPFPQAPPREIRAILWQYRFTTPAERRRTGDWWQRTRIGLFAPELRRDDTGRVTVVAWPHLPPRD